MFNSPDCMLICCLVLFVYLCLPAPKPCLGDQYLAILRQEHGLGVTEGLPDIMLGIRVMGARDGTAQRHRVQGVGGDGALHPLHGQLKEGCAGEWRKVERTKRGGNAIYCMQNRQQWNHRVQRERELQSISHSTALLKCNKQINQSHKQARQSSKIKRDTF